jgi:hypothetical protein
MYDVPMPVICSFTPLRGRKSQRSENDQVIVFGPTDGGPAVTNTPTRHQ